ncbi:3-hydroxyacyl-CoA dehydrogenase [Agromyces archimandritae]|uniref:3-hydroxyacyl-CoA dehydrogenase n=1 Tax=Agromyces archimandritae TaxID=2781962 RepID=A0A975FQ55_9MICO|nr:3-hydroxyacyl-CoA dehydrogenase [Agromyces archimandritae]QTX05777.1 3-hydroxyacyl-CoA dehydrogenase [Agromyces archimandritae]
MTALQNVTVLGTGVLGSQIAFQTAYHGHPVVAYDIGDEALAAAEVRFAKLAETYRVEVDGAADGGADAALARIRLSSDLADAVKDADLVIEAVPENPDIKRDTYERLAKVAPEKTVFATNSSTLLPSQLAPATGRPDRFLALHYANHVWEHNTAEIMGTEQTDPAVYRQVVAFAESTGMVPIEIKKEKAGYLLNSLLVPLLTAASDLLVDGIAEPETIDKTWRIGTGAPAGPFQIFDVVGLTTAYNISAMGGPKQQAFAKLLKEQYIDRGKLGVATGEGFYRYG